MTEMQAIELAKKFAAPANATRSEMLTKVHILGNRAYATNGVIAISVGIDSRDRPIKAEKDNDVTKMIDNLLQSIDEVGDVEPLYCDTLGVTAKILYDKTIGKYFAIGNSTIENAENNHIYCPHCGEDLYKLGEEILTAGELEERRPREENFSCPVRLLLVNRRVIILDLRYLKMAMDAIGPHAKAYSLGAFSENPRYCKMIVFHNPGVYVFICGKTPSSDRNISLTINTLKTYFKSKDLAHSCASTKQGGAK